MKEFNFLAVDLGATSGRTMLGSLKEGRLSLKELTRFPNGIIEISGKYYWDIYLLFGYIKEGMRVAVQAGVKVDSIGVDTWGVDFVYVAEDGTFLGLPRAYRDPYTNGKPEAYFEIVSKKEVYAKTGIQIMSFNSLFQLYAAAQEECSALKAAKSILFMPDALSYLLTGTQVCEYTIASTSQFLNPMTKLVEAELLEAAGVSADLVQKIVMPGTVIGSLTERLANESGLDTIPVIAVAGHDTGSAVAAIPACDRNFAYLSSGTWSLMGVEVVDPIVNETSFRMNFTNEGGVEGTTRFLKNITGMWLLEQCRKEWEKEGVSYTYPQLMELSDSAVGFRSFVDPDDAVFTNPERMTVAIKSYCEAHGSVVPCNHAEIIRCIFESLALKYRLVLNKLKEIAPFEINKLHVIGGGSQNDLLNQFTANSIGLPVIAGPSEATAYGNVMMQAKALGAVNSLQEMRNIIAQCVEIKTFAPQDKEVWEQAYHVFLNRIK